MSKIIFAISATKRFTRGLSVIATEDSPNSGLQTTA